MVEDREINMGGGWKMTIRMDVDKYGKSFIEIAKVRNERKIGRFKLNPRYAKELGELLIDFSKEAEAAGEGPE
ncbi:hypothetical protein Mtc_2425 [Methanocella conradii HZ254]|uniref:Transcriptional Coactivator p15 (PC4) n=2 Tax=Methanocella TaxID=570266 RepID=H8I6F6_METCZ|nr:hypothetical protein Mtc_2425 [Methanocella conradii HZ254]